MRSINLLALHYAYQRKKFYGTLMVGLSLVTLLSLLLHGWMRHHYDLTVRHQRNVRKKINHMRLKNKSHQTKKLSGDSYPLTLVHNIIRPIPADVWLTNIAIIRKKILVSGKGTDVKQIIRFQFNLNHNFKITRFLLRPHNQFSITMEPR